MWRRRSLSKINILRRLSPKPRKRPKQTRRNRIRTGRKAAVGLDTRGVLSLRNAADDRDLPGRGADTSVRSRGLAATAITASVSDTTRIKRVASHADLHLTGLENAQIKDQSKHLAALF